MATSNLKNKTLGKIEVGSGVGTPNHIENTGSLYIDSSGSSLSKLITTGATDGWNVIPRGSYAVGNTTGTTSQAITSAGAWIAMTGSTYNWSAGTQNGFTHSLGNFTVLEGNAGFYSINGVCSLNFSATANEYYAGISVNNQVPLSGEYYGASLHDASFSLNKTISWNIHRRLNVGDKIGTAIAGITNTSTVNVKYISIIFQRIND